MNNKSHNGIEGKISFDEYRVLEINYKLNSEFDSDESIVISFELGHDYQIYKNGMNVQLERSFYLMPWQYYIPILER